MKTNLRTLIMAGIAILIVVSIFLFKSLYFTNTQLRIYYPINNALFPADFAAPTLQWKDLSTQTTTWKITINIENHKKFITKISSISKWRPSEEEWDSIRKFSNYENIELVVEREGAQANKLFSFQAKSTIKISTDPVGATILYREIPLPFTYAETHIDQTSYATYNVTNYKEPKHEVLGKFKVCGNCHSSSADGKTIALDFDAVTRDKGGYFVAKVDSQIIFDKTNYMSWSKLLGKSTFGLFSKISRNGRYIVTTVKDRVISKKFDSYQQIAYSQLFVPVNGVLAIYDTETKKFNELPGANDTSYIQTNAIWTPDDKYLIFARAKALPMPTKKARLKSFLEEESIIDQFVKEKIDLKFELYIIPFNEGKGGVAKPIAGASNNHKSNYFPAITPDGKWLVYCQSSNYMMLRRDSRMFIIPMLGGKPREMECNLPMMNSWHSISPNSKWMVFTSKSYSYYTDLFLTHIDENGKSSMPIFLENQRRVDCASNYPEFMNVDPNLTINMKYNYVNIQDVKIALGFGEIANAKKLLKDYLDQGQIGTPGEYREVSEIKLKLGEKEEAKHYGEIADKLELIYNTGY